MMKAIGFLGAAMLIVTASAAAQSIEQQRIGIGRDGITQEDTGTWAEGHRAGRAAAGEQSVALRGLAAFLGGLPLGFFGLIAVSDHDGVPILGSIGGLAIIGVAARGPTDPPDRLAAMAAARGKTYAREFAVSYSARLQARRDVTVAVGGAAGAATGFGFLVWLLSHFAD